MAEFKLGRLRFVWQGNWTTGYGYVKDDVVRVGGKTYVCVIGHTASAAFATDLNAVPTKWNQVTDGSNWTGNWATNTQYNLNDLVKYGGMHCLLPMLLPFSNYLHVRHSHQLVHKRELHRLYNQID